MLATLVFMVCATTNGMLFCAVPETSKIQVSVPNMKVESMETQWFYYVSDISDKTVVDAIYGKVKSMKQEGCKLTTTRDKVYYFGDTCEELEKKMMRGDL